MDTANGQTWNDSMSFSLDVASWSFRAIIVANWSNNTPKQQSSRALTASAHTRQSPTKPREFPAVRGVRACVRACACGTHLWELHIAIVVFIDLSHHCCKLFLVSGFGSELALHTAARGVRTRCCAYQPLWGFAPVTASRFQVL